MNIYRIVLLCSVFSVNAFVKEPLFYEGMNIAIVDATTVDATTVDPTRVGPTHVGTTIRKKAKNFSVFCHTNFVLSGAISPVFFEKPIKKCTAYILLCYDGLCQKKLTKEEHTPSIDTWSLVLCFSHNTKKIPATVTPLWDEKKNTPLLVQIFGTRKIRFGTLYEVTWQTESDEEPTYSFSNGITAFTFAPGDTLP